MKHREGPAESWPPDTRSVQALVARITRDIDESSEECRDLLLSDLLCAAWPTIASQDQ
jgi:hypothetical protein